MIYDMNDSGHYVARQQATRDNVTTIIGTTCLAIPILVIAALLIF
jgi:hypothetical protein